MRTRGKEDRRGPLFEEQAHEETIGRVIGGVEQSYR
jgi:hypothetical protein